MTRAPDKPTRRELLAACLGGGAAGTAVLLTASEPARAATALQPPESEAERIHRLVSVEMLLLFAYQHVLGSALLTPTAQPVLVTLRSHEEAHIRVLNTRLAAMGETSPPPPADAAAADRDLARRHVPGRFGQLQGPKDALRLLLSVERVVVGAYFVALSNLQDSHLLTLGAQIMANEAQHEALLGELLYMDNPQRAVPYGLVQGVE